jgi:transcriptional regulator
MTMQIWFEQGKDFLEIDHEAVAQRNNKKAFKVKYNQSEIIDAIKSADIVSAKRIVDRYSSYFPQDLLKDIQLLQNS